jgi:AAA domain
MVGSRKLTRLLEQAQQGGTKVVLVGDDRQLGAIDAGGGFRALRLRLGASELVENRRQQQAWEREALELVRSGLVEEAVAAYQAHDRVVAADSKPAATLALLQDWWTAWQPADHDPAQEVVVLAGRRVEVARLNSACQELPAASARAAAGRGPPAGRRGPGRLRPQRHRRVGGCQWQPGHRHRPRPLGPDSDPAAGWRRRPGGHPAPGLSGRPRPRGAEPARRPGLRDHRPPRPGLTRGGGPWSG